MKIAVIDSQGGGLGKRIVEKLSKVVDENTKIIALGTNSIATMGMLKAGAHSCATGENAIKVMSQKVDIITGAMAICVPNSMMGEISESIAYSIGTSTASKILLPLNRCGIKVAGVEDKKANELIDDLISLIIKETKK
ncbi:DUF3842 family protein [Clostridium sediminicola]|uniref:DUF3842 family protein n=1 Tax=Clostridium sediminicola TaxID=3114879 RepID=UPI0031F1D892